ncbi:MAG: MSHA pilin protein MshA [Alphaproteobacteria bacterium]|jgi:MSHA pilin protein MshA
MKQQKGFTLIELIIVIVILGILAVTAAPRFIDIQSDARKETLQGVKAAVQGASQLVYAKSAIAGVQREETSTVTLNTGIVNTEFGYPNADMIVDTTSPAATAEQMLQRFVDIELGTDSQLVLENDTDGDDTFRIRFSSITTGTTGCYIDYTSAALGNMPTITLVDDGC